MPHAFNRHRCSTGFTLVELLVVIAIIALLVATLLPALGAAKESALRVRCLANLHQMSLSMSVYSADFQGKFPITPYIVNYGNAWSGDHMSVADLPNGIYGGPPPAANPTGWYQLLVAKYVPTDILICPGMKSVTGETTMADAPVGTLDYIVLDYGYRYNNFEGLHELPHQGESTADPGVYPREPTDTMRVLFNEASAYRRDNTTQEIHFTELNYLRSAWPHKEGGNVLTFSGSGHWLPNSIDMNGNNVMGAWPNCFNRTPYCIAAYLWNPDLNVDAYLRNRL